MKAKECSQAFGYFHGGDDLVFDINMFRTWPRFHIIELLTNVDDMI